MSNTSMRTPRRLVRAAVGVTSAAGAVVAGSAADVDAARRPKPPAFTLAGTGTWQVREFIDDVVVNGTGELAGRHGRARDVQVAAVIQTDDRTLPEPGECETAFATVSAYGVRGVDLTLVGMGEVCGTHVQPPTSIVTHVFTGDFEVYGEHIRPRQLRGVDGFYEVRLAEDGSASVFAIDT